jgi:hypothetical protein
VFPKEVPARDGAKGHFFLPLRASPPHTGKHPFSLNLANTIAQILLLFSILTVHFAVVIFTPLKGSFYYRFGQILLLFSINGPFCSGHFHPFKGFFLLWIWTLTIPHPDVKT